MSRESKEPISKEARQYRKAMVFLPLATILAILGAVITTYNAILDIPTGLSFGIAMMFVGLLILILVAILGLRSLKDRAKPKPQEESSSG